MACYCVGIKLATGRIESIASACTGAAGRVIPMHVAPFEPAALEGEPLVFGHFHIDV